MVNKNNRVLVIRGVSRHIRPGSLASPSNISFRNIKCPRGNYQVIVPRQNQSDSCICHGPRQVPSTTVWTTKVTQGEQFSLLLAVKHSFL